MKIFNAEQIRKWDAATIAHEQISQAKLMERAGDSAAKWLLRKFPKDLVFCIICGKGGNGGDGLVAGRRLLLSGYKVSILLLTDPHAFQGATLEHWSRFHQDFPSEASLSLSLLEKVNNHTGFNKQAQQSVYNCVMETLEQSGAQVIVDAVLGTGYKQRAAAPEKESISIENREHIITRLGIRAINAYSYGQRKYRSRKTVSIDLPSGLSPDQLPDDLLDQDSPAHASAPKEDTIVKADYTLSFQTYKRSFMHPEAAKYVGKIKILDIGLSPVFFHQERSRFLAVDLRAAARRYRPRTASPFGHKGSFGTAVLIGGSYGKIGSIGLSARAALRTGAGKVFIQAPKCGYEILQTLSPESMFEPAGESYVAEIQSVKNATYGLGPGMDTHPESATALFDFLKAQHNPVLLDADALNIIAADLDKYLTIVPKNSILTPHPGEFKRLFGPSANSLDQVDLASEMAQKWQCVIVLKGHRTAICSPEGKIHYNLTGNAGMATAGSGDVLTGIITSLLAQGIPPGDAAILGVFLHGLSGDLYIKKGGQESLIAADLIENLPMAFKKVAKYRKTLHLK